MPKWRRLSGADVLRVLAGFGFQKLSQRGSHVKVRRYLQDGSRQSLTVPLHDELDRDGTRHLSTGSPLHTRIRTARVLSGGVKQARLAPHLADQEQNPTAFAPGFPSPWTTTSR